MALSSRPVRVINREKKKGMIQHRKILKVRSDWRRPHHRSGGQQDPC